MKISMLSLLLLSNTLLAEKQNVKTIAITQIVSHVSLDLAKKGILDELRAEGFEEGKNLKVLQDNAQGNIATANAIAKKYVGMKDLDAIIPISTPSAQAVRSAAKNAKRLNLPIVFASVSDPVGAGLIEDLNKADSQITGAYDAPNLIQMQALLKSMFPKVKRLGVLYNSGEANSAKTIAALKTKLDPQFVLVESTIPNSNKITNAIQSLVGKIDALYIPLDNTVVSALPTLVKWTREYKIPTFSSDPDTVKLGILACYGDSQYMVGRTAGAMLAKILKGTALGQLKVQSPVDPEILVNTKSAKNLGISIPSHFQKYKIQSVE